MEISEVDGSFLVDISYAAHGLQTGTRDLKLP